VRLLVYPAALAAAVSAAYLSALVAARDWAASLGAHPVDARRPVSLEALPRIDEVANVVYIVVFVAHGPGDSGEQSGREGHELPPRSVADRLGDQVIVR